MHRIVGSKLQIIRVMFLMELHISGAAYCCSSCTGTAHGVTRLKGNIAQRATGAGVGNQLAAKGQLTVHRIVRSRQEPSN